MKKLYIEPTDRTPKIEFNDGHLLLWGTFVPDDPYEFYSVLHDWIKIYSIAPAVETVVEIGIAYVRGFAMDYVEALLQEVILLNDDQHKVIINWYFSANSISIKAGKYLSWKLEHPFVFLEVEDIQE
jgi:hypothetical protein